ncbi:glycosyltransferase [Micrococcus luteus]|uniref:glycosyltransferase family 2 protein n=1 Tax=Micrococcus TaxID=1269 RepID=UPI000C1BFEEC|nr:MULTISPECIES: glycosyltransferase [Micrococcus]MBF0755099.1 glycosyltransferase [Micrococcus aloeverae]MCV7492641.1 glycosyltransferase [Micrococcus luteus]MCV7743045.1 glycosyltransferase [Micrococcus luteus]TFU83856.1 glycosyltransferase [Micrococcus aloeverae]
MTDPKISVIIPCYRSGLPLKDQLAALLSQTDAPPREILLCDNGGNPWLHPYVASLAPLPEGVFIRVIDADTHPGASFARNRGINEASAERLAFCDDDDLVHPDWCRLAYEFLDDFPVVTGGVVVKEDTQLTGKSLAEKLEMLVAETVPVPPRPAGRGSMGPALMGGNFAARRDVLLAVGGFDAALVRGGEDNDLAFRLDRAGVPITDCGAMSIIYSRPSAWRDRVRTRARAGRSLAEAASARDAWHAVPELSSAPTTELTRAGAAAAAMAAGLKARDWPGAVDRVATAWGLVDGWTRHRVLRRQAESQVGLGLGDSGCPHHPGTTVLVVAYNHAPYVIETLESIRRQTVPPVRVLIADDASPRDDTAEVIRQWLADAPSSFEFHPNSTNMGLNPTLNRLLDKVDTEFVTYIAGDDTMRKDRIAVHEKLLRTAPDDVVLAYSDAVVIDENSSVLHPSSRVEFPWPDEPQRSEDTLACLVDSNWIPAASFFMRTGALRREGGYAEDLFYEDFELLTRLAARYRFTYTEEPLVAVRRLATSLGAVGFAHDSPRFVRSMFAALRNAEHGTSEEARELARSHRWELTKRAARIGMPFREVLAMFQDSWRGAATPAHAAAHLARMVGQRVGS